VPTPHHIIGLAGKSRSGKDTVAAYLVEHYGFARIAFADALREAALALDPIVVADERRDLRGRVTDFRRIRLSEIVEAHGWEEAKAIPEVRRTLQRYGVAIRDMDPEFWIRVALSPIGYMERPVVITDVRFPNEVDAVRSRAGLLVRVSRPGANGNGHISETAIDDVPADVEIHNAGSLLDLADAIDRQIGAAYNLPFRRHYLNNWIKGARP
jgi:hypothetical protein